MDERDEKIASIDEYIKVLRAEANAQRNEPRVSDPDMNWIETDRSVGSHSWRRQLLLPRQVYQSDGNGGWLDTADFEPKVQAARAAGFAGEGG